MRLPQPARLSATVLILRQSAGKFQVLMQKRGAGLAFGAQWVFPGGTVSEADGDPESDLQGTLRRAAIRETWEEARVRLAPAGTDFPLVAWSRWITPAARPRRFDAWFFAAELPEGERALGDGTEAVETEWVEPVAALDARDRGRMAMMPPTAITLLDLAATWREYGSVAALLARAGEREIVPIQPRLADLPEGLFTVYPWDPQYGGLAGEGIVLERVPDYLQRLPSRMPAPRVQP
jgi:8-oxo-dGTP pyrophosphatase MutT (NUDIX family)